MLDNFKFFQIFAITDPQTGTAAATGGTTNGKKFHMIHVIHSAIL